MICTESYFGVPHMHIVVVACRPPKPKVFFFLSFFFSEVVYPFFYPEYFIALVVTEATQNSGICTSSSSAIVPSLLLFSPSATVRAGSTQEAKYSLSALLCSGTDRMYLKIWKESNLFKKKKVGEGVNSTPNATRVNKNNHIIREWILHKINLSTKCFTHSNKMFFQPTAISISPLFKLHVSADRAERKLTQIHGLSQGKRPTVFRRDFTTTTTNKPCSAHTNITQSSPHSWLTGAFTTTKDLICQKKQYNLSFCLSSLQVQHRQLRKHSKD